MSHLAKWRIVGSVSVRRLGVTPRTYASLAEAVSAVGWPTIRRMIHVATGDERFADPYWRAMYCSRTEATDLPEFREEGGVLVPLWRIVQEGRAIGLEARWDAPPRWLRVYAQPPFRAGPVAGLIDRRSYVSCRRNVSTFQETAAAVASDDEDDCVVPVRAARRRPALPSSRDDHVVRAKDQRSWKAFRRTRWKS